tara:strand:- start:371 stop:619 length:249 start_codon:yes stop_codon:yes gene_type:complete
MNAFLPLKSIGNVVLDAIVRTTLAALGEERFALLEMLFPNAFPPRRIVFCANNFEVVVVVMMIDFNAVFVVAIILMMVSRAF